MRLPTLTHLDMHQLLHCPHTMAGSLLMILHTKGALFSCEINLKRHIVTSHSHWDYDLQRGNMIENKMDDVYTYACVSTVLHTVKEPLYAQENLMR